ncbi:MAG: hypothetical protein EOP55_15710 [Sphingobacteriales bacterium]|nr:MAG: hypothetical protein EOP55_15710 [Sphingobacteriales bacterium]
METLLAPVETITPENKDIIKPSKQFVKEVHNSINAISVFIVVYILLFLCAVALAVLFGAVGVGIISLKIHWLTIALGLALIASGLMLIYFLIKFLFKKHEETQVGMVETTRKEQPELFAFLENLTRETQTSFPKHVYLSAEVNASVFYNSSFWSMFFPVKKNLNIGLGLVNSVNQSEFKAVLAHEFGHFSQRSMKFGSYVYNLNRVIHNMLYENDGYAELLDRWARIHSLFGLTALINIKIIKGIQFILQKVYVYLNKSYLRLSREMEFHADTIAAFTAGSNNAITASRRINIGQTCFNTTLGFWNSELKNNKISANIYPQQAEVIRQFANSMGIELNEYGLPLVAEKAPMLNKQQVIIEDQWSSHPSTEDREASLEKINIIKPQNNEPAWALFKDVENLQKIFTVKLYEDIADTDNMAAIDSAGFRALYTDYIESNSYNKTYKGYYDQRLIHVFDIDEAISFENLQHAQGPEQLLTDENLNLPKTLNALQADLYVVDALANNQMDKSVKTFDFRGDKYRLGNASEVKQILEHELEITSQKINLLDKQIFIAFYNNVNAEEGKTKLANMYRKLFIMQAEDQADYDLCNNVADAIAPMYSSTPYDEIPPIMSRVYEVEKMFKKRLKEVIASEEYQIHIKPDWQQDVDTYLSKKWTYFVHPDYDNGAIAAFNDTLDAFVAIIAERTFQHKKKLLDYQLN